MIPRSHHSPVPVPFAGTRPQSAPALRRRCVADSGGRTAPGAATAKASTDLTAGGIARFYRGLVTVICVTSQLPHRNDPAQEVR